MTRIRLRPRGSVPAPILRDWEDDQATCPGCGATIYSGSTCCGGTRSRLAFAATINAYSVLA